MKNNRGIIIAADQSNGGFCVLGHSNASFAQSNIMRVMRPISLPACFGQQRYANRAHCV